VTPHGLGGAWRWNEGDAPSRRARPGAQNSGRVTSSAGSDEDVPRRTMRGASFDVALLQAPEMRASIDAAQPPRRARSSSAGPHAGDESSSARRPLSRYQIRSNRNAVSDLEEALQRYEHELAELGGRLSVLTSEVRGGSGCNRHVADTGAEALAPGRGVQQLEAWKVDFHLLQQRLETLAADALEGGCNRDMAGVMDVFEAANSAVERMAGLQQKFKDLELEAATPARCDPIEWRIVAMSDSVGANELEALRWLCEQVSDCEAQEAREPATLLRYLRAREGHVVEAEAMFRSSMDWRARYHIEQRSARWQAEEAANSSAFAQLVSKYKVHKVICQDRFGMPVWLFRWSVFDITGAERELGTEMVLRVILCIHERMVMQMRETMFREQVIVPGGFSIWDIGNYGKHGVPNWWSRMLALTRFLPKVANLLEINYPEVVRKIMVVRSGPATKALYHTATPFLPSSTLHKCKLYGWRACDWLADLKEELATSVTNDDLPAFLVRDDEAALAMAEPKGGMYPHGAADRAKAEAKVAHRARGRKGDGSGDDGSPCMTDSDCSCSSRP